MPDKDATALRKRAQIAKANRTMFIWVAAASVIVSASVVMVLVMAQKGMHNQKAIGHLHTTVSVLKKNNASIKDLEDTIRALGSDQALLNLRANKSDNALQVILDALPVDSNPSALGASLQTKLFPPDLNVESMSVVPGGSIEAVAGTDDETTTNSVIAFRFTVSGDAAQLKTLLERLERSIRTIQVNRVLLESAGSRQTLQIEGEAYYEPSRILQLTNLDVQP